MLNPGHSFGKEKIKKKTMGYESDGDTNYYWRARYSYQRIVIGSKWPGNKKMSEDHPNRKLKVS